MYRPQTDKHIDWNEKVKQDQDNPFIENKEIILMGDLNIDLLKPDVVSDIVEEVSQTQLIHKPSRVTVKLQTMLNHMYVTVTENIRKCQVPNMA